MNVAFVTHRGRPDLTSDDRLAASEIARRGGSVDATVWDDRRVDWQRYDAIVLRSCWDYHVRSDAFAAWIDDLERRGLPLENPAPLVRWNLDKRYLLDLASRGLDVVETIRIARGEACSLDALLRERGFRAAVVKPAVSASARRTWLVDAAAAHAHQSKLDQILRDGDALVQPFVEEVRSRGEWSLVCFDGTFSHAVLKRPGKGDFRVQEEHGGSSIARDPGPRLVDAAARILERVGATLYARVDGIEVGERFVLVELELIEPVLFLGHDPLAPKRFADAIERATARRGGSRRSSR